MHTHILKGHHVLYLHWSWSVFLSSHFLRKGLTKRLINQRELGCINNTFLEFSDPKLWPWMASYSNCSSWDASSPSKPLAPATLTCVETPALCCRRGWWQGPVCWTWCARGTETVWYCPGASAHESGPCERTGSVSQKERSNPGLVSGPAYVLFTWRQCVELQRGWGEAPLPQGTMGRSLRSFQHRRTPGSHSGWTSRPGMAGAHPLQRPRKNKH